MGAVLQIITAHDFFHHGQKLGFIIFPAGFDGCLAGNGVQNFVPNGSGLFTAAAQQVSCHFFDSLGCVIGTQIHGDLTQQNGIFTKFVDLKAQFVQKLLAGQQLAGGFRRKTNGNGSQQRLRGNFLLICLQLFKEDSLMGSMLVDQVGFFALLYNNIGIVKLTHHAPLNFGWHSQFHLLRLFFDGGGSGNDFGRGPGFFRHGRQLDFRRGQLDLGLGLRHHTLGDEDSLTDSLLHAALDLGSGGNGGSRFWLRRIFQRCGESLVLLGGHSAEEGLLLRRCRLCRCGSGGHGRLRNGLCLGCGLELHVGAVRGRIQRAQNTIVDAVKDCLFVQKFHFRLGRVHVDIHHIGGKIQMQHASGKFAHHDLVAVSFLQRGS